jgi:branched-chain amino acid transport system permease protein
MLGALVVAVVLGIVVERLVVRPLFDAPRVTLLVATAGVALLATAVEIWFGEATARPLDRALPTLNRVSVLGVQISDQRLMLLGVLVALAILLALFFRKTNLGLAILGASQEPTATELMGISVKRLSTLTWAIAALLGGLAGVLAIPEGGGFAPGALTVAFLIPAFTAAVLGGMTSLPGAFLGGVIVGVVEAVGTSAAIFEDIPGTPGTLLVFLVLLIVLTVRPQGLLGGASR